MGRNGIPTKVPRLCEEIDTRVKAFSEWPIEGDWPTPIQLNKFGGTTRPSSMKEA